MMHVFIPLPDTGFLFGRVIDGLKKQTNPCIVHECKTPRGKTKIDGERASRILCQEEVRKLDPQPEYVVMCDGDRACANSNDGYKWQTTNVEDAENLLRKNPNVGAVSLIDIDHWDIGWVMYRADVFLKLDITVEVKNHFCDAVKNQIEALQFKTLVIAGDRTMHC
jgi:hypothetical protein